MKFDLFRCVSSVASNTAMASAKLERHLTTNDSRLKKKVQITVNSCPSLRRNRMMLL